MSNLVNEKVFIWTEAFNCGEILNPMLESFIKHNNHELNVFGSRQDLGHVKVKSPLLKFNSYGTGSNALKLENKIQDKYNQGHKGTAELWANIIMKRKERYFLHLDADTIFLADVVSELLDAVLSKGFNLAGARRPYYHRTYRKIGTDGKRLDKLPDVVATDCFIFDKSFINLHPAWYLKRKIEGRRPVRHPVIDFFDPISFEIISKGGKVLYLDSPSIGSIGPANTDSDFHLKRISFAAVGSGSNFFKNQNVKTSPGYKSFALASYSLFCQYLLDKDIGIEPLSAPEIVSKLEKLDKNTWTLDSH